MKKMIPITDLQRQAGQIVGGVVSSDVPVIITQRGRPAAVLVSARRYSQLEAGSMTLNSPPYRLNIFSAARS